MTKSDTPIPAGYKWIEEPLDAASTNLAGKSHRYNSFEPSEMVDVAQTALDLIRELAVAKQELQLLMLDRDSWAEQCKQAEEKK